MEKAFLYLIIFKYFQGGIYMEDDHMSEQELVRLAEGLRASGWNDTDILNFILYIMTGDEKYKS